MLSGYSYTGRDYDAALADLGTERAAKPRLTVPTTIVRGEQDRLQTPADFANDGAKFTAIERSVKWPDAGHFAHREQPNRTVELILGGG